MQLCVATDTEGLLRPRVGEGRNTMLRIGWCVSPVSVAVHDRFGSSLVRVEEQKEKDRWSVHLILYGSVSRQQS